MRLEQSAKYRDPIAGQNRAIDALAIAKSEADVRAQAAHQLAAANGKRFDLVPARTSKATAATCVDAMQVVNEVLESVR